MVCQGHQRQKDHPRRLFCGSGKDQKSPSVIPLDIEPIESSEIPAENDLSEDVVENSIEPSSESPELEAADITLEVAEISGEEADWDPLATEEIEVEEVLEDLTTDSSSLTSEQPAANSQEEEITEETTEITTETSSEVEPSLEVISEETESIDPVAESELEEDAIDPVTENESESEEEAIVAEVDDTDTDTESEETTDEETEDEDAEDTLVDIPLLLSDVVGGLGTVTDPSGQLSVIWKFDGGAYEGQVGVVSTAGLENYDLNSIEFMQEALRRALANIVVDDTTEGAEFSGWINGEDSNHGEFTGEKVVQLSLGEQFFLALIPNGTFTDVLASLEAGELPIGATRPLFSLATANPKAMDHFVQLVDLNGKGTIFALEDIRADEKSDWDLNDLVITLKGANVDAANLDDLIASEVISEVPKWMESDLGITIIESAIDDLLIYQEALEKFEFPKEDQPLIGFIDTHLTQGNPDIDYSRIIFGKDWIENDSNPTVVAGQGTHADHILGIVAATQDNGLGIDGINDDAPLWVSSAVESGKWADALVEFVDAAIASNQPNAIINLSIDLTQVNPDGSVTTRYEFTPQERGAIEYARQSGVLIVAASGNDGGVMSVLGQASQEFDNIITVGAADGMARAAYSSYGYGLDIVAPGGSIDNPILSNSGDGLGTMAGTSVATAQVTGAASQVWAANPELSYRQVIEILKQTATDINTPGWDAETGAGILNITAAVGLAKTITPVNYEIPAILIPDTWDGAGKVLPSERAVNFRGKIRWDKTAVQINGGVNVRSSASSTSNLVSKITTQGEIEFFDGGIVGQLVNDPNGQGSSNIWYRLANGSGYVSSLYIQNVGSVPAPQPVQPSPVQPQPLPQPQTTNNTLYLSTSGGQILAVNTATGQQSQIYQGIAFTDLAVSSDNRLFGSTFDSLYEINPANGQARRIGNFGGKSINSLTFSPDGRLYGADDTNGNLYQISLQTAQLSQIGSLGGPSSGDMVFNGNEILATVGSPFSSSDRLVAVSLSNGSTRIIGDLGYHKVYGLAQVNGQLTAYTSTGQKLSVNIQNASTNVIGSVSSNGEVWGAAINPSNNSTQIGQPPSSPTSITIGGYTISGNFYPVFKNYQGTLGNPTSGIINHSNGVTYQIFQNGSIVSSKNGTFPLYGAIRQTYLNNNGLNGSLGAPTSPEIGQGNGVIKQTFEGGYIIWNGRTATAYRIGSAPSPSPNPTQPQLGNGQRIIDAVNKVNPDQWYYRPRDITGDRVNETFCNWFVADVLDQLGVPIPRNGPSAGAYTRPHPIYGSNTPNKPFGTDQLLNFFNGGGNGMWERVSAADAVSSANNGQVVLASNNGHVAVVIPGGSGSNVRIAQAGATNGKNMSVDTGFGSQARSYFRYKGSVTPSTANNNSNGSGVATGGSSSSNGGSNTTGSVKSTLNVTPFSSPWRIGVRSNPGWGSGSDFKSSDQGPELSSNFGHWGFEADFWAGIIPLPGTLADEMAKKFLSGDGGIWEHGDNSTLSNLVAKNGDFQKLFSGVESDLRSVLENQIKSGNINLNKVSLDLDKYTINFERPNNIFSDEMALWGTLGGTQGTEVYAKYLDIKSTTIDNRSIIDYSVDLDLVIYDDFGAGDEDNTSNPLKFPLRAMWHIQHRGKQAKPFVNKVIISRRVSGQVTI